jgi:hypothetical protein
VIQQSSREAVAVQVNDRLKAVARRMPGDPNLNHSFVQARFVYERLLARLQRTAAAGRWVLKGGVLMLTLPQEVHRVTMDVDFSVRDGRGTSFTQILRDACAAEPDLEDGLSFELVTEGKDAPRIIREESDRPTARASLSATLLLPRPNGRKFVVDATEAELAFEPTARDWQPTIKGFPALVVPSCPWELVLAEKLHAILTGSMQNPRLRDYMDVIAIARSGAVDMASAGEFLARVFEVRGPRGGTGLDVPGLSPAFASARSAGMWPP